MNPASALHPSVPSFPIEQALAWGQEETNAIGAVLSSIQLAVRMADSLPPAANLHTVRHLAEKGDVGDMLKVLPHCGIDEQLKREAALQASGWGAVFGSSHDVTLSASLTAAAAAGRLEAVAELLAVMAPYLPPAPGSRLYEGCERALMAAATRSDAQVLRRFDEALTPQVPQGSALWNQALGIALEREDGYAINMIWPHAQPEVVLKELERKRLDTFVKDSTKVGVILADFVDLSRWGPEARAIGAQVDVALRQLKERGVERAEDTAAPAPAPALAKSSFMSGFIDRLMRRRQEGVRPEAEVAPRAHRPR